MSKIFAILLIFCLSFSAYAKDNASSISFKLKGQLSAYTHFNPSNQESLWLGGRYLPQLNSEIKLKNNQLFDIEASANVYGNLAINPFETFSEDGNLKPYRLWARYSNSQFEIRAGLQKINFGSASMLRPLMWFDQIDPRDPLKLTDGVWGILGRYYFLNNANVWLWGLYGNKNPKGWEQFKTNNNYPEFGGRLQLPLALGETAFSYHHRIADMQNINISIPLNKEIVENRFGYDIRLDWLIGCWFEASWVNKQGDLGILKNQEVMNLGFDYTIGIGSGLYMAFEQLLMAYNERPFVFEDKTTVSFSLLSMSYPVGLFDNVSAIVYYDWKNNNAYNFVNYQKQIKNISLFAMAYWNPESYAIPTQGGSTNLFGGKGIQLMLVWNH